MTEPLLSDFYAKEITHSKLDLGENEPVLDGPAEGVQQQGCPHQGMVAKFFLEIIFLVAIMIIADT